MQVKLKSSDAINLHLKSQVLFLNMPESNSSLEWNVKVSGMQESKIEPKGFASYNEAKAMLSTTHIRIPPQFRLNDSLGLASNNSRAESIDKERKHHSSMMLQNFETLKRSKLHQSHQNTGTKTPLLVMNPIEKSPKMVESSGPSRHISFQNLSMNTVSSSIKKKLSWHMDQEALLSKKRLSSVMKMLKNMPNLEDSSAKDISAVVLHLTEYFEAMLQRLFFENKAKFTSSAYFRALFSEEFYKEIPKRSHADDYNKGTPANPSLKSANSGAPMHNMMIPPATKKISNLISTLLISPGQTPSATDRMLPRFGGAAAGAEKQRKRTNLNMDPTSDFFRRHSLLLKSYNTKHVREWNENITFLKPMEEFTVLVVDDAADQLHIAINIISSWNEIYCEGAYDGLEAVQMVRNKMNEGNMYHLILTDLTMPHDGYETTKDIRKEELSRNTKPKYCIIGVTAEGLSSLSDVKAKQCGMDDTTKKPLNRNEVKKILLKRAQELGIDLQLTDKES